MNKNLTLLFCLFSCTVVQTDKMLPGDNSKTSVDWEGVYFGILPCADCAGIKMELKLKKDLRYEMITEYLAKEQIRNREVGTFNWNNDGNRIILLKDQLPDSSLQFHVGENKLRKLDLKGQRIEGRLAEGYVLFKTGMDTIVTEKYWKLIELYGKSVQVDSGMRHEPYFILHLAGKRVSGNGGCNQFFGEYELQAGNRIRFTRLASTLMACPDMDDERKFINALETADNYTLWSDTLSLNKGRIAPLARFVAVYLR